MRQWFLMLLACASMIVISCAPAPSGSSDGSATSQGSSQQSAAPATQPKSSAGMPGSGMLSGVPIQTPYITWGGDYPTFWGVGGHQTREGTIFGKYGVNLKMVDGDDTDSQLADYKSGKSPFLRGTFVMIGVHAQELCQTDPGACPMFAFQMTYSAGDHLVVREGITDLTQLEGKTIAIQRGGPHLGFLYAILKDADLKWSDVNIRWVDSLDGPTGPMGEFEKDASVAAAFVITPEMYALTGGPDSTCDGAECSVIGAHVLVSTADRLRTIADSYFVRKDWAMAHPDELRNFAAGYMYSTEAVKDLMNAYDGSGGSDEYVALMNYADETFAAIPTFEDADGLYRDARFVGHQGNLEFMNSSNSVGYRAFVDRSVAVANELGLANGQFDIEIAPIDWNHAVFSDLRTRGMQRTSSFNAEATRAQIEAMTQQGTMGNNTALSFTAGFAPNQKTFPTSQYAAEFDRMLELSESYSTAPLAIRCHADPLMAVGAVLKAGMNLPNGHPKKVTRTGSKGNYAYFIGGRPLNTDTVTELATMLHDPAFQTLPDGQNATQIATAALTLSEDRCHAARDAYLSYAQRKGKTVDPNQITTQGVGIREPVVVIPRSEDQAAANRRVEFAIVSVQVESTGSDFDW